MAKVLFVVYVPSSDPEVEEKEDGDEIRSGQDKDSSSFPEKNGTETVATEKPEKIEVGEYSIQDEESEEKNNSDSPGECNDETKSKKEQEVKQSPAVNTFFKSEDKEDNDETVSRVETEDSQSLAQDIEENLHTESDDNVEDNEEKLWKPAFERLVSEISLIEKVKRVLDDLNVGGVQWNLTEQNIYVGMFIADYGSQCEDILRKLSMLQIGVLKDSSVSVFPASISSEEKRVTEDFEEPQVKEDELSERYQKFKNSIKSRLVVDQVVNAVNNDAKFTFDYLMLVILASLVAFMGLLESSSVVLVASMLISPLMGPILAGVFGVVIHKSELIRVGIVNELRGLTICVLIGFVIGFIPACIETGTTHWRSASEWPTPEMSSRGALRALPVGVLIAVPSGAGVALSILGGKVGSLVGVAISASLLPPAVNAGLLWANAIVAAISPPAVLSPPASNPNLTYGYFYTGHGLSCPALSDNDYDRQYFCSMAKENVVLGFISLLLTILNIFCIILMGVVVLKIKEVAPIPHSFVPESESEFFCQDLKIARYSNKTIKGEAAAAIRKDWLKSYQEMKTLWGKDDDEEEEDENQLDNIIDEVEGSPSVMTIYDKMQINPPSWRRSLHIPSSHFDRNEKFDFSSTPTPSPQENPENGIELRQRNPQSPSSSSKSRKSGQEEDTNAVYFTVHRYIDPQDLLKGDSYAGKSGKFIKTLKLPKASRFMIARVEEDPAEDLKPVASQSKLSSKGSFLSTVSEASEPETQPLIHAETSTSATYCNE